MIARSVRTAADCRGTLLTLDTSIIAQEFSQCHYENVKDGTKRNMPAGMDPRGAVEGSKIDAARKPPPERSGGGCVFDWAAGYHTRGMTVQRTRRL